MHIDEALEALQSNENRCATMYTQEAQKSISFDYTDNPSFFIVEILN